MTPEEYERVRAVAVDCCERAMDNARSAVAETLERVLHEQLREIHARSFPRHRVEFLEGMGMAGIRIVKNPDSFHGSNIDVTCMPDGLQRCTGLMELDALLDWYVQASDDANIEINALRLAPITGEQYQ